MIQRGVATVTLDTGTCPKWLFERMVKLGREMIRAIVLIDGPDEFVKKIGDPTWLQSSYSCFKRSNKKRRKRLRYFYLWRKGEDFKENS